MEDIFFSIFQDLPRQGPGNKLSTKRAIDLIKDLPTSPRILDLGCGSGAQTIQLAHYFGGTTYALDNHKPYLDQLSLNSEKLGYGESIKTVHADMNDLEFDPEFFDLIWAEGSLYILGFREGLRYLKKFLSPAGYLAVTEVNWLRDGQPQELLEFWDHEYPEIMPLSGNIELIKAQGYKLVDYFTLSPVAWWDNYYTPLEQRLVKLRKEYVENDQATELIESVQVEIDMYRKYPEFYGYVFYIMRNC